MVWPMLYGTEGGGVNVQVIGFVNRVMDVEADVDLDRFTMAQVESNAVRCPDSEAAERMYSGALCVSLPTPKRYDRQPLQKQDLRLC